MKLRKKERNHTPNHRRPGPLEGALTAHKLVDRQKAQSTKARIHCVTLWVHCSGGGGQALLPWGTRLQCDTSFSLTCWSMTNTHTTNSWQQPSWPATACPPSRSFVRRCIVARKTYGPAKPRGQESTSPPQDTTTRHHHRTPPQDTTTGHRKQVATTKSPQPGHHNQVTTTNTQQ